MKRCPACQRMYADDTLTYCLEDGSTLLSDTAASSDLAATLIIPDPRETVRGAQETYRPQPPSPRPLAATPPAWSPVSPPQAPSMTPARKGRGAAITSLIFAIVAFALLGFCIIAGAANVNNELIGGVFIFSVLLALAGAVFGIVATSRSSKDTSAQNSKAMSIVALVLNGLYLLITIVFLILAATVQSHG
jgi:hypothetical protein